MSEVLIPFARNKFGEQVSIDEVKNGLACQCTCISCKSKMVAKNLGELKQAHFAHLKAGKADLKCEITFENSVFWMSEDIIKKSSEGLKLLTPRLISEYDLKTVVTETGFRDLDVESVNFLPKINAFNWSFLIDVVSKEKRHPLAVTLSFVRAPGGKRALQYQGKIYSTLLIDLSGLYKSWTSKKSGFKESLHYEVFNNPENRFWQFHERSEEIAQKIDKESKDRSGDYYHQTDVSGSLFSKQERENLAKLANEVRSLYRK